MSKRCRNKGNDEAAVPGGEDRLTALPEDVIRLLLSFLPSREAVQTCVLATCWRNLWKSVPSLRIDMEDDDPDNSDFVNTLLRRRDPTPLQECEILVVDDDNVDNSHRDAELWLRYAVSSKVRDLRFKILTYDCLRLSAGALVSEHLSRLNLFRIEFEDFSLDVSSCRSLEELEIDQSVINIGEDDFPESLRLLRVRDTRFLPNGTRSIISAPGLVTLELADCLEWTPWLKSLPSLVTAFINIGYECMDSCHNSYRGDCGRASCVGCYGVDDCVLLGGLSGATNLELISHRSMIFRKEITWCPVFSKLRTLLLGDWCLTANFSGLVHFLQHSPILERFTLQLGLFSEKFYAKTSAVYKPKEQFLVSEHLKAVEIKYFKQDGRIDQILNVLDYHGVQPDLIKIKNNCSLNCFSYACQ